MPDLGNCSNVRCDRLATHVIEMKGRNRETGEWLRFDRPVCDEHYADLTTPCAANGCTDLGVNVVQIDGTRAVTGERHTEQVAFCDRHLHQLQHDATVTIDGLTMVHDGRARFKRIPPNVGRDN